MIYTDTHPYTYTTPACYLLVISALGQLPESTDTGEYLRQHAQQPVPTLHAGISPRSLCNGTRAVY